MATRHWKDVAIERSEAITDAWEVVKAYLGRAAEWVLFLCLILCLVEVLPGVSAPLWFQDIVIGVQAVMLDVGGFALASLADHARAHGNEQAAKKAETTGKVLIGIVILTVALLAAGVIAPAIQPYTNKAELGLLLVRVVMTVVYGHVLHGLRRSSIAPTVGVTQTPPTIDYQELAGKLMPLLQDEIKALLPATVAPLETHSNATTAPLESAQNEQDGDSVTASNVTFLNAQQRHSNATKTRTKTRTNSATPVRSEKARKAASLIKRNPQISATDLALKAEISPSYARQLLGRQEAQG